MTKYINTSGHSGPEWILSNFGIGEHLREVLGDAGVEVFGITFTHSNVPTTAEVSTLDGIVKVPFKDLDAEKSDRLIRESFNLDESLKSELVTSAPSEPTSLPEQTEVEFVPSEKFVEQVEEAVEAEEKALKTKGGKR